MWRRPFAWQLLLVPGTACLVVVARQQGWEALIDKSRLEELALPLLALGTIAFGVSAWRDRRGVFAALTLLSFALFCREVHFRGSGPLIYGVVSWLAVSGWRSRAAWWPEILAWRGAPWLVAALVGYCASQIVAHRWLRWIPGEPRVHVPLEEGLETVSHLLLLVAAAASLSRRGRPPGVAEGAAATAGRSRGLSAGGRAPHGARPR